MNKTFLEQFLGTSDTVGFLVNFTVAAIGALIMLRYSAIKRDKLSQKTPYHFSKWFLFKDNIGRILNAMLLIYVGIRASDLIFGSEVTFYIALAIGASLDKVSEWVKNLSARG